MIQATTIPKENGRVELPWLQNLPNNWHPIRTGFLFRERVQTGSPDLELLSITCDRGIIRQSDTGRKTRASQDRSKYKVIKKGELAFNLMNAFSGAIAVSPYDGILSPAYAVCESTRDMNTLYFHYLLQTPIYLSVIKSLSYGIMYERNRLYFDRFRMIHVPLPPRNVQDQIVYQIHEQDQIVAQFIRRKKQLIDLLNERKRIVLQHTINKTEHAGEWEQKPLKRWARINELALTDSTDDEYEFDYIDIGSVSTGCLSKTPERMQFANSPSRARRILRSGDTILSTVRTYLKAVYFIQEVTEPQIASTGFAVLTPRENVLPELLSYLVQSPEFISDVMANSVGVAYPAIAETRLGTLKLSLPTRLDHQMRVLERIKAETRSIDESISRSQREIELVLEYRSSFITRLVTGEIEANPVSESVARDAMVSILCNLDLYGELLDAGEDDEQD